MEDRWAPWVCILLRGREAGFLVVRPVQGWCMGNVDHAGRKGHWNADQRGLPVETANYKEGEIEIRIKSSKVLYMGIWWSVFSLRSFLR